MVRATVVALAALLVGAVAWVFCGGLLGPGWAEPVALMVSGLSMALGSLLLSPRAGVRPLERPAVEPVEAQRATA